MGKDTVQLRSSLRPGDIGKIVYMHGIVYAEEYKFDLSFEAMVAETLGEIQEKLYTDKVRFWLAEKDDKLLGSIAIVEHTAELAQLRWFMLMPEARGKGVGKRLLNAAVLFCIEKAYQTVFLETIKELGKASSMYHKIGFRVTDEFPSNLGGKSVLYQRHEWELNSK